ncbi:MAG: phage integrase SAM-like domain-containing protein [Pirellulales bacterium]
MAASRTAAELTLEQHLQSYVDKRGDVKPATAINWGHSRRCLLAYFGAERSLASITAGEARDWERWLKTGAARENRYDRREAGDGLAPNTVRKRVSNAKQFFADAMSRELIDKNPFAGLKGSVGNNRERDYFVSREVAEKVLAACPDNEWRLLFALSRYGGLRCPSEHLALTLGGRELGGRADGRAVG